MNAPSSKRVWLVVACLLIGGISATGCVKRPVATPTPTPTPQPETQLVPPQELPPVEKQETQPERRPITANDLQPAFFDYDSYTLRDDAKAALDQNARLLRDDPSAAITIEGHCDERGTVEYNQALGEKRAQAAREYLVAAGVDAGRIQIISYGKERPFASGHDDSSWQQNRRAHFVLRTAP